MKGITINCIKWVAYYWIAKPFTCIIRLQTQPNTMHVSIVSKLVITSVSVFTYHCHLSTSLLWLKCKTKPFGNLAGFVSAMIAFTVQRSDTGPKHTSARATMFLHCWYISLCNICVCFSFYSLKWIHCCLDLDLKTLMFIYLITKIIP